jgi:hypothetical protein
MKTFHEGGLPRASFAPDPIQANAAVEPSGQVSLAFIKPIQCAFVCRFDLVKSVVALLEFEAALNSYALVSRGKSRSNITKLTLNLLIHVLIYLGGRCNRVLYVHHSTWLIQSQCFRVLASRGTVQGRN